MQEEAIDITTSFLVLFAVSQVEHPVTEWISNVNIPSVQLLIAAGVPLHRIADIRRLFGRDPSGTEAIDFEADPRLPPAGHVVAVRITAGTEREGWVEGSGWCAGRGCRWNGREGGLGVEGREGEGTSTSRSAGGRCGVAYLG